MFTAFQLADAFPECADLARKRLRVLSDHAKEYEDYIAQVLASNLTDFDKQVVILITKNTMDQDVLLKEADTLRRYLKILKNPDRQPLDVAAAKAFPIEEMFDLQKARFSSKRIICCCPLHHDKNPSFVIYKDTNSFFCFSSCHKGGDAITLYMELHKCSFVDAVKTLGGGNV